MTLERMSPVDTAWLHMDEPGNPADIVTLLTLDEQLPYNALKDTIEDRLLKYERFKQRVTDCDGHPSWEHDEAFHIERHVTHQVLDAPLTTESLRELVGNLGNQSLRKDRPSPDPSFGPSETRQGFGSEPRSSAVRAFRRPHDLEEQADGPSPHGLVLGSGPRQDQSHQEVQR